MGTAFYVDNMMSSSPARAVREVEVGGLLTDPDTGECLCGDADRDALFVASDDSLEIEEEEE